MEERFWEPTDYVEQDILACFGCIPDYIGDYLRNPFETYMRRRLGHTTYLVETEYGGKEPLTDKLHRLIFSDGGAAAT